MDPACGSGSFLISAVSKLNDFYAKAVKNYKELPPSEKLELIKKNIFGVDLDERAVSIAKLNIYLKILRPILVVFRFVHTYHLVYLA